MSRVSTQVAIIGAGIVGTYLARQLVRRGINVAIIEKGAQTLARQKPADPPVECPARRHDGVYSARNQVLGGNGHYWGGGLVRPTSTVLGAVLGVADEDNAWGADDISCHLTAVERDLNLVRPPQRHRLSLAADPGGSCDIAEILILPGKARNVAADALAELGRSPNCLVLSEADVVELRTDGKSAVCCLHVSLPRHAIQIASQVVVICAGPIDTNVLLWRHRDALGLGEDDGLGRRIHDHISVPLFAIDAAKRSEFLALVAPTFRGACIVGKRFEFAALEIGRPRGVLHFQFLFDQVSPYREIKQVLALRQQGAGLGALCAAGMRASVHVRKMVRIGIERYARSRLHIDAAVPVVATLDFESTEQPCNRLELATGERPRLHWNLHPGDEGNFGCLLERSLALLSALSERYGLSVRSLGDFSSAGARAVYLRDHATDAYHLGGGIPSRLLDRELRLKTRSNVFILSGAVFQRPGLANPTLTLLALAHRCADAVGAAVSPVRS